MLSFDAPSRPSALTIRAYTRPRFDTDLDVLRDWLDGLKIRGVRHAGPTLVVTLENLRKTDLTASRRITILSLLKTPLLKTCAGLPKPRVADPSAGVTMEQRLLRLMFVNLDQALHQLDKSHPLPNARQHQQRLWLIRNLLRFAGRQLRYALQWQTPLAAGTWRDLHELYGYLTQRRPNALWDLDAPAPPAADFEYEAEYKMLLLLGLAATVQPTTARRAAWQDNLPVWAAQTRLEDPHNRLGRLRVWVVEVAADGPPRQLAGSLDLPFRGWVLEPPYPYLHQLDDGPFGLDSGSGQAFELALDMR